MKQKEELTMVAGTAMTINEAMDMWMAAHPKDDVTRQTVVNWVRRYKFELNPDRVVPHRRILVNREKFAEFSKNPGRWFCPAR